jgi:hypothetical protein
VSRHDTDDVVTALWEIEARLCEIRDMLGRLVLRSAPASEPTPSPYDPNERPRGAA